LASEDTYSRLITLLDQHGARYRLIEHAPEGRTEIVSPLRGNALSQAAKCIILMVKIGKKVTRYVLGVVPGDARIDLDAVKRLLQGTYVAFASSDIAERLAGSVAGTILPFSFNDDLELIVDPTLLENDEIFFNAARLDRSVALNTQDYVALAKPRMEQIAKPTVVSPDNMA
jgi:Ala-tRNA(Pro) deacylase